MARTRFKTKVKNGNTYYFYRLRHANLRKPRDIYARRIDELEEKIKALTRDLDHGVLTDNVRFGDYMKAWIDNVHVINKKRGTVSGYYSRYDNYIVGSMLYSIRLKDLTVLDVQEYLNTLLAKGISYSIVSSVRKLISPCIRYAYTQKKIIADFSRSITLQKPSDVDDGTNVAPLTKTEQAAFLAAIRGTTYEPLFLTALNTGARIGELLALTWEDINLDTCEIRISKTLEYQKNQATGKYENQIVTPKTKASNRIIPFPKFLIPYLQSLHNEELKKKMRLQNKYADLNLIFANRLGYYLQLGSIRTAMNKIQDEAGLRRFRIHDLRHTFATRLFELGESPKTVQVILGHSDVTTTLNIYTHVMKEITVNSASRLNTLYNEQVN